MECGFTILPFIFCKPAAASENAYGFTMIIDCHCHIFNSACTPVLGMARNRLLELLYGSAFEAQDKDNIGYILTHLPNYLGEIKTSRKSMEKIVEELFETGDTDICVPLMMNFDYGYASSSPATPFAEQLKAMIHLTLAAQGRILPFFAFDPRSGLTSQDPIRSAREAIERQGFVGIKLYPPLGYSPCNNQDENIDNTLRLLYEFCCFDKDGDPRKTPIPITAHCSWCAGAYSNVSVPGIWNKKKYYRNLAHPSYWEKVLKNFPLLKLNLAHFGGLGEWEALTQKKQPNQQWIDLIRDLILRHENVYTDLSFLGLPASNMADAYHKLLLVKIRDIEDRILLGSDWYISQAQCTLPDYWHGYKKILSPRHFSMMTEINAISFLHSDATQHYFPAFFRRHHTHISSSCIAPFQDKMSD
jgi:predicted TIM-barrel fold metal-dependent hydrolase